MIREAIPGDKDQLWEILEPVIRAGDTYTFDSDMGSKEALNYWVDQSQFCFVVEEDGDIVGTYYMRRNQAGGGGHVCNCGYIVSGAAQGRGVAKAMCDHSQEIARLHGYLAMQFNFVVSTNADAVRLWQWLGFEIVGTLPNAFDHPEHGFVDAYVMHKEL